MAMTEENLRAFLIETVTATVFRQRVHVDTVPGLDELLVNGCLGKDIAPYIWLSRSSVERERCLGEQGAKPDKENFDIEIYSSSPREAKVAAELIHSRDSFAGAFGADAIHGFYVDDQSDEYVFKTLDSMRGQGMAALNVQIIH